MEIRTVSLESSTSTKLELSYVDVGNLLEYEQIALNVLESFRYIVEVADKTEVSQDGEAVVFSICKGDLYDLLRDGSLSMPQTFSWGTSGIVIALTNRR